MAFTCIGFVACNGDEDEPDVKFNDVTLTCNETYSIKNGTGVEWRSSNELIASVSGNVVTAGCIGEAVISSTKGSFKVTVKGTIGNVYQIPCLNWGASKSTVKSFMKGRTIEEETSTDLVYAGSGAEICTMYSFENSKLSSSSIALDGDYINSENLIYFLLERYVPLSYDEDNYYFYFTTPDLETGVVLALAEYSGTLVYLIVYVPISENSRSMNINSLDKFDWTQLNNYGIKKSVNVKGQFEEIKNLLD